MVCSEKQGEVIFQPCGHIVSCQGEEWSVCGGIDKGRGALTTDGLLLQMGSYFG